MAAEVPNSVSFGINGSVYGKYFTVTDAEAVPVYTAPSSSHSFYITDLIVTNKSTAIRVLQLIGNVTIDYQFDLAANGGGFTHSFRKPIKMSAGSVTAALDDTADSPVKVTINGFWSR